MALRPPLPTLCAPGRLRAPVPSPTRGRPDRSWALQVAGGFFDGPGPCDVTVTPPVEDEQCADVIVRAVRPAHVPPDEGHAPSPITNLTT